jgi:CRISPR/Cas system-associated exonuclease Cas4 (RecB family)
MADFKNEFSWSPSRDRLFERCLRAYYWRYYAHWNGWRRDSPEEARVAYRLGKQDSFPTWGGTIVHDVVEGAVKALRDFHQPIDVDKMKAEAKKRLRTGWVESRDGQWIRDPKRKVSLWEHYYGGPDDRSKERTQKVEDVVYTSLDNFASGPFPPLLARLDRSQYRAIEALDSIKVDGNTVYVKPDLAFDHPDDGTVWLVDWKTGRPKEADQFQVATYALYAREKWGVDPAQARGVLAYLYDGTQEIVDVAAAAVDTAADRIRESMKKMQSPLVDIPNNEADRKAFPLNEDQKSCGWCNFKQLCFGGGDVPGAQLAGDGI